MALMIVYYGTFQLCLKAPRSNQALTKKSIALSKYLLDLKLKIFKKYAACNALINYHCCLNNKLLYIVNILEDYLEYLT